MTYWLGVIAKGVVIAICAAGAAVLSVALFAYAMEPDTAMREGKSQAWGLIFGFALLGSMAIGLPVALLTFIFASKHLAQSPATLAMIAVLAGIMLVLASFVVGDEAGVYLLGLPAFAASLTYALLGWFWVVRPLRKKPLGDANHA